MTQTKRKIDKLSPHNTEAEQSVLGCILLRPSILRDLAGLLDPSDFNKPGHQFIYDTMCGLHARGLPVDAVTVADELERAGLLADAGGRVELLELQNATPAVSNWSRYAEMVIDESRRRRLIFGLSELKQSLVEYTMTPDQVIAEAASLSGDHLIAARGGVIPDLRTGVEFREMVRNEAALLLEQGLSPWLIPGTLKRLWRVIIVAGEGVGKAVLMRFLALHVAAGRDPWEPSNYIEPRRVLYVDCENESETIDHQHNIVNRRYDLIGEAGEFWNIWHREAGINLRSRRTQAEFDAVLTKVQPEIVCAGPLYKLFRRTKNEDMEMAALEFTEILDDFRKRFGFGLILEHHAPKAQGGATRDLNPFGSSLFMRWPVLGITLEFEGHVDHGAIDYSLRVGRFRRDRVLNDWPTMLTRNSNSKYAFSGYWPLGRGQRMEQAALQGL